MRYRVEVERVAKDFGLNDVLKDKVHKLEGIMI